MLMHCQPYIVVDEFYDSKWVEVECFIPVFVFFSVFVNVLQANIRKQFISTIAIRFYVV